MKGVSFLTLFLSIVMLSPVITPILQDNHIYVFSLMDKSEDYEKNEKRETNEKDELDQDEKFLLIEQISAVLSSKTNADFLNKRIGMPSLRSEVLTPPPEFI